MSRTPTPQQAKSIIALAVEQILKLEACAGSGKCLGKNTPVLMYDGSVKMVQDVAVGDTIMGPDSTPRNVLSTVTGVEELFRITPVKGESWVCNRSHILTLAGTNRDKGTLRDVPLSDYLAETERQFQKHGRRDKGWKQKRFAVDFPHKEASIPPYLVGLWLGDGTVGKATMTLSSDVLINYVKEVSRGLNLVVSTVEESNCFRVSLTNRENLGYSGSNVFYNMVKQIGETKHIPSEYKVNSRQVRLEVLAGVIDTDGHLCGNGYEVVTRYDTMKDDLLFLCRSVGLAAYSSIKTVKLPEWDSPRDYHRVTISGDTDMIPCLLKKAAPRQQVKDVTVTGFSVESIGEGQYFGFEIDGDRRFLLGDFTVTHNTSTLVMMADSQPVASLYLAFNKVTANEAAEKFPSHVTSKTTHSVAYSAFGIKIVHKLSRPKGRYVNVAGTGSEVARYFKIAPIKITEDITIGSTFIGMLTKLAVARFEQSADDKLELKHVPAADLYDKLEHQSVVDYVRRQILPYAQKLWKERTDVRSPVLATHDTYLKMFQLSKPVFHGYEILYVDEAQDSTPCVLDIILNQKDHMKIVFVGDARQAIYGWRGAVNAMNIVEAPTYPLTQSFRYGQAVADIATAILERDMVITGNPVIQSKAGFRDMINKSKPYTRLFRTNSALLGAAIAEIKRGTEVSIEIDVKDFVKVLESTVALYHGDMKSVKHDKMVPFQNWEEMLKESKQDFELARLAKVVKEGQAEEWIECLQSHVNSKTPHVTFTTAHKSKGREWSQVRVESDFKECYDEDGEWTGLTIEEQNLLYVACTRAIDVLQYNITVKQYLDRAEAVQSDSGIDAMFKDYIGGQIGQLKRDMEFA